ncbi:MAG: extracellular solute-binding protein [Nitrospinota bacterium]
MKKAHLSRRTFLRGAAAAAATGPWVLRFRGVAEAGPLEDRIIAAAKKAGPADLNGMIWSLYYRNMKRLSDEFKEKAGVGVKDIQDISIFDTPKRAMAEAISRSPTFDFFHIDSNMIPSLASAGLIEPLDDYMAEAGYKLEMLANFANFMRYKGKTYGIPTDGNVHIQYVRKDLLENPEEQKRFSDKHGRPLVFPKTWEESLQIAEFFHRPDQNLLGFAGLRNRANGVTWWYMHFYSAGGFPFNDDLEPTLNTKAGEYAMDIYLQHKKVSHPEAPNWGTPQMIPQIVQGRAATAQYWDGTARQIESDPKSATKGKFLYGIVPGSTLSGKLVHRSISSPLAAILVNRYSPRKRQAALMAMYWGTLQNSVEITTHPEWTFHDPWHAGHMTNPQVIGRYSAPAMEVIAKTMHITTPPIYLTGHLEFQDLLGKHISEAYIGQITAKQALTQTEEGWRKLVAQISKPKLKEELAGYKAAMPNVDVPS